MIEEKCRVCGQFCLLTDAFCPSCGYEIHIYPSESKAMAEYEEIRAQKYRKVWGALNESQVASQRLEAENSKIQHKLDGKEQELKDRVAQNEYLEDRLKTLEKERNQLRSQIEEKLADLSERKGTIQKLKDQISDYLDQRARLKKEKEDWKSSSDGWESKFNELSIKMSEAQDKISQLKSQLRSMTAEKERLEVVLRNTNPPSSTRPNRGERKGLVIFTYGQHTIKQDIYSGNNIYKTPQPLPSFFSGDLFAIVEDNGVFTIFDRSSSLKKASGRGVGEKGEQLFNGDVFSLGPIQIQIDLPDINFDDINF